MIHKPIQDTWNIMDTLETQDGTFSYVSLKRAEENKLAHISKMPYSIRILFESVLRNFNGNEVNEEHVKAFASYKPNKPVDQELPFVPARVLLQDFTGVPCVVDLAAMRSALKRQGKNPELINPGLPVNLIIDHSLNIDFFNSSDAMKKNTDLEFLRNRERYEFLRWGQENLENFTVIPPASGICHQVNLEYLAKVIQTAQTSDGKNLVYFDTLVGTDSHTTMINGLGVLGWGVGGIEAEAAMLGQPIYMLLPPVVGVKLKGQIKPGVTSTDIVLKATQMLRAHGVVGKIVEYFGPGIAAMSVPDRATLANMAPEYGATAGFFPVDKETLDYLYQTGRDESLIRTLEAYYRAQNMFWTADSPIPDYETVLELDLSSVQAAIAGPKRPQDRLELPEVASTFYASLTKSVKEGGFGLKPEELTKSAEAVNDAGQSFKLRQGDIVISSITSCTNTSSPSLLLGAGLLAKKAVEKGLKTKPWVKTSFAPGSRIVTEYLKETGLMTYLEALGFYLVGYGCATCIGNSGPLPKDISRAIDEEKLLVAAVLSGNRNFEGRVNPQTRANFLASPPLCVAYALAGNMGIDLSNEPLGRDADGNEVFLKDIWPSEEELQLYIKRALKREEFIKSYTGIEYSNAEWNSLKAEKEAVYPWRSDSTYIQEPPFFENLEAKRKSLEAIKNARVLASFGDSITTDHISPAGSIAPSSPAGKYLESLGLERKDFNSYGSRRGNDRVMARGTFANIRIRNKLLSDVEGGYTKDWTSGETVSIYDAAMKYIAKDIPVIILAGKDYGMGSSRDWAAKGVMLLGVKAVIAESFERIHRSNLVGMGILPLQFKDSDTTESLGLKGNESFNILLPKDLRPKQTISVEALSPEGTKKCFEVLVRIDSSVELSYYQNGGILNRVLNNLNS